MLVGIVGARSLPDSFAPLVSLVVSSFLSSGFRVTSGGAVGADSFALSALLQQGAASRGIIFSAWDSVSGFPVSVRPQVNQFLLAGGEIIWGAGSAGCSHQVAVAALLSRNRRLVSACSCVVAFLHGQSRGTLYTIRQAVAQGIPVYVFLCEGGAQLPEDLVGSCKIIGKGGDFNAKDHQL